MVTIQNPEQWPVLPQLWGIFCKATLKGEILKRLKDIVWFHFGCVSHSVMSNSLWPHGLYSLPGSSVHGIFQARILEWVNISFSRGSSWPRDRTWVSCIAVICFTIWATREAHFGCYNKIWGFPGGSDVKVFAYNAGHPGLIPRLGRSPGERNGTPLQYSCLENFMGNQDREACWVPAHRVVESDMTEN